MFEYFDFSLQYHSTSAPYYIRSFLSKLYNLIRLKLPLITHLRSYVGSFLKTLVVKSDIIRNGLINWNGRGKKEFLPEEDHVNPVRTRGITFSIQVRGLR